MTRYLLIFSLSLAHAAGACGDDGGPSADAGPQEIELGTGGIAFEPLEEDQNLLLVSGTQGGFHFVVNARIRGFLTGNPSVPDELGNPLTRFSIFEEGGRQIDIMPRPYRLGYRAGDDGWFELPSGRILQVDQELVINEGLVPAIYGERVRLFVEVRDAMGTEAEAEIWVIAEQDFSPDGGLFVDAGVDGGG
jgi:hypothetical protein